MTTEQGLLTGIYILLGVIVVLVYALLFLGKHGVLTGTEDEDGETNKERLS